MAKSEILINGESHNVLCFGIDLGTTNSVIAMAQEKPNGSVVSKTIAVPRGVNRISSIGNRLESEKRETLPSCIYYNEENKYQPIVGDFAKDQFALRPHLVAKSIKSQMGNEFAQGLSENIPDKTPSQISSRILQHLLKQTGSICKCDEISDAIITVPANFDSAMCRATIEAAELAGIKVKNNDGSDRPILLSEPNAAIYDFLNQYNNGDVAKTVIDFDSPKTVMVFDLGGGTLDITLHEIKSRGENYQTLKIDEIATNRYTLLGGDNFDEAIAENMFDRFLKSTKDINLQNQLLKKKKDLMPRFIHWAENLKKDINVEENGELDVFDSNWGDDEDEEKKYLAGGVTGALLNYDDEFTKKEVEEILEKFMGSNLTFNNYKNIENIKDTNNIIYPILDVLSKASKKLGDNIKIDAVILNGGMSRFYMVRNRLENFFGSPDLIVTLLDPDLAVARGAAIYHYYLHKDECLQDDMRKVSGYEKKSDDISTTVVQNPVLSNRIEWGSKILNDALYLGLKEGNIQEIVPTGAKLPYESEIMKGYKIQLGTDRISVPIKSLNIDGTYRTISTGKIQFEKTYQNGAYVAFKINMSENKVINMTAWTSKDEDCEKPMEMGSVEIAIGDKSDSNSPKIVVAKGMPVNAKSMISTVLQLCDNCKNPKLKANAIKKRKETETEIFNCSNKKDFAQIILTHLSNPRLSVLSQERLIVIARKIGAEWSDYEKTKLASICMTILSSDLYGMSFSGEKTNLSIQSIYTLGMCGSENDLNKLEKLHKNTKYKQPCLYTHGKTKTQVDWVFDEFYNDFKAFEDKTSSNLQFSAYAIGNALKNDGQKTFDNIDEDSVVDALISVISSNSTEQSYFVPCIIAIGLICDTRTVPSKISENMVNDAVNALNNIDSYFYEPREDAPYSKSRRIALKMIYGEALTDDEEKFLLEKIESV